MTVTGIERVKNHLVSIFLSNGENLLLDIDLCAEKCIHEGDELSAEQIKNYLAESDYRRAKQRALWLLDRYEYTERRLFEKLKSAGFSEEICSKALARLKELGLIDDKQLSLRYAEDCARRCISKREAYQKLRLKGFNPDTINKALDNTEFNEKAQITALLERKYKNKLLSGDTEKVYAALIRKGFSYTGVREALKKYSEEIEFSGDI